MQTKKNSVILLCMIALAAVMTGCVNDKDLYDPDFNKNALPSDTKDFGFATRGDVTVSVDYNVPGVKAYIEVYDEDPMQENSNVKKEGITPIYTTYTNENGKFEGKMYIPTRVKEVYLYTDSWVLPQCVKMNATAEGFSYRFEENVATRATTRSVSTIFDNIPNIVPYAFFNGFYIKALKSLSKWDYYGSTTKEKTGQDYLTITNPEGETINQLGDRIQRHFNNTPDKKKTFVKDASVTNITVKEDGTTLDVVFIAERAFYQNTFGYYYYKKGTELGSRGKMANMEKFVIFPNVEWMNAKSELLNYLPKGGTARLKFFGEKYDKPGVDEFPKDYVIGWFFISDGFSTDTGVRRGANTSGTNTIFFSDDTGSNRRFVALDDAKSDLLILGFEDQVSPKDDEDYSDVLFYVKSNADLSGEDRPILPEEKPLPPVKKGEISGTLNFEDNWPKKGDYDLNDVVIEYKREVLYDGYNKATQVVETFKFVQRSDAAFNENHFAYQVEQLGTVVTTQGCTVENETGSIIIDGSSKANRDKTITITRKFEGQIDKDVILKDFNPFIIVGEMGDKRTEVHLPKFEFTSKADPSKPFTGNDAWYMDIDGKYPFAIDIPIHKFGLSPETIAIDTTYPKFRSWADSKGTKDKDWYKP